MPRSPVRHAESSVTLAARSTDVFAYLDDHRRLASHMTSRSMMMAGASMHIDLDDREGRGVGAVIVMRGRVLGVPMSVEEVVTEYVPHERKAWATRGNPRLFVIGGYRMGFETMPVDDAVRVRIWIDWDPPPAAALRWLRALGDWYAHWCVQTMLRDCTRYFSSPARVA